MCGIAGYIHLAGTVSFSVNALLERMQKKLIHRGPDGCGIWTHSNNHMGIAHTRLSIIDTSPAGAQPMWNRKKTVIISFNGEIYNYRTLRKQLEQKGHLFTTSCDTEVLLAAYEEWGINCLEKFEGMFAFILIDVAKDEIYIIRDRIGIKPLFFATDNSTFFACASEIKVLWEIESLKKEPCPLGIKEFLNYLQPFAPKTVYKNVFVLPPGHFIHIDAQRIVHYHQWYNVLEHAKNISVDDPNNVSAYIDNIDTLLHDAIQKRLVADVSVGAFLSGGLDSSLITALMACYQSRVKTFTLHIEGNSIDERKWAKQVAAVIKSEHYDFEISQNEYLQMLEEIQSNNDEPMGDPLSAGLSVLACHMKQHKVPVCLFGEGADELFAGYPSYLRYQQINPFFTHAKKLPRPAQYLLAKPLKLLSINRAILADALHALATDDALFKTSSLGMYNPAIVISKDAFEYPAGLNPINFSNQYKLLRQYLPSSDFFTELAYGELLHRIPQVLLPRFDHMTMHHAVEGRVPYLDHHLIAYALHIPHSLKIKNKVQKWILKKVAEKYLPNDIIYRPKTGFTTPLVQLVQKQQLDKKLHTLITVRKDQLGQVLNIKEMQQWCAIFQSSQQHALPIWLLHQLCSLDMFA